MNKTNYGWVIVAAMLVVQSVSSGFGFYNMSVYMAELAALLARPLSDLSLAVTIFFLTGGVAGLFVAELINRYQIRWIMVVGALTCGLAFFAMSVAREIWQIYACFFLFGLGNTGVSLVVATTLITRWFPGKNRSIALSVSSTGLSLGGVTLTPLTAYLFNTLGVYESFPILGLIFVLLILPIAIFLVRPPPEEEEFASTGEAGQNDWGYGEAIKTRFFQLHSAGYALIMMAQVGGIAHLYGRVNAISDFETASLAVSALGVASILFRFAGGIIATRVPIRTFTLIMLVVQGVGLLSVAYATEPWQGVVAGFLLGTSVGNLLMLQPLWLAEVFPGRVYPRVFALASGVSVLGVASGPYFMGLVVDGISYSASFLLAAVSCILAWLIIFLAGPGPKRNWEPDAP